MFEIKMAFLNDRTKGRHIVFKLCAQGDDVVLNRYDNSSYKQVAKWHITHLYDALEAFHDRIEDVMGNGYILMVTN